MLWVKENKDIATPHSKGKNFKFTNPKTGW